VYEARRNKEERRARDRVRRKKEAEARRVRERNRYYAQPEVFIARNVLRRAKQLNATPPWVDRKELTRIYTERPEGLHVDHIIPLNNDRVCGLHVPWNLQYLTPEENFSKGNRW
jgi:5-methylcytosine-specific restriction endonuclease McrA